MITIKSKEQIELMRKANIIVRDTLQLLTDNAKVGISTYALNKLAHEYIVKCNAVPSFLNFSGYPASICVSIDDEVVHGIPNKRRFLEEGQIVSFDVGAIYKGWNGDAARTVAIGSITVEKQQLIDVTKQCFFEAVKAIEKGYARIGDIGHAVQSYAESYGYGVVRDLVGHGIGENMHEEPDVPNFGEAGKGYRLQAGMTIAIEPMITLGTYKVNFGKDGWTVTTRDHMPSAHYENTIAITDSGVSILSL